MQAKQRAHKAGSGRSAGRGAKRRASPWSPDPQWQAGFVRRRNQVADGLTIVEVSQKTGYNHETVRRYMRDGLPGAEFLKVFCDAYGVSSDWLLLVKGKRRGVVGAEWFPA